MVKDSDRPIGDFNDHWDEIIKYIPLKMHGWNSGAPENDFLNELIAAFYYSQDGVYIVDGQGVTVRVNPAFERITGITANEVVNKHMMDLVERGYFNRSVAMEVIKTKRPVTIVQTNRNGKVTLTTGNPVLNEEGEVVRVISNIRDITKMTELYEELSRSKLLLKSYSEMIGSLQPLEAEGVVAESESMRHVIELANRAAAVDSTVLLLGESGVGKGVIANLIYRLSFRSKKPFITVNCGAIPDTLLESELFGYSPGAFTGANKVGKAGLLESAHGGTIFLDEIAELPLTLQPKILHFLETGEIAKIGSTKQCKVDVRVIAATNRELKDMVAKGTFREDLYYRLNVIPITIPPLRNRKEDIIPLIARFVDSFNKKNKTNKSISSQVIDVLLNYSWPGNVRELKNLLERLMVLGASERVTLSDLPREIYDSVQLTYAEILPNNIAFPISLPKLIKNIEDNLIEAALLKAGSIRKAAALLGVNPSTVYRKMTKGTVSDMHTVSADSKQED
jgi:PAS domain S-box-containing protein